MLARVRSYRAAHELPILSELAQLLAIPNVASDRENIRRNADAIVAAFARRGIQARLLESPGAPPAVFAEVQEAGSPRMRSTGTAAGAGPRDLSPRRTVVFYAHYDGQPVDPARWTGGKPWEPVIRDGPLESGGKEVAWSALAAPVDPRFRLYARSSSDDKAAIVGMLSALDALRAVGAAPTVNLKFWGSGPNSLFTDILKAPVIGVPIANHDNNQHAANENLRIGNLWDGIEMYAALMARLGPSL